MHTRLFAQTLVLGLLLHTGCKKDDVGDSPRRACEALEKNGYAKDCKDGSDKDWEYLSAGKCKSLVTFTFTKNADQKRPGIVCELDNMANAEGAADYLAGMNDVIPRDYVFRLNNRLVVTTPILKGYEHSRDDNPRAAFEKIFGVGKITEVVDKK